MGSLVDCWQRLGPVSPGRHRASVSWAGGLGSEAGWPVGPGDCRVQLHDIAGEARSRGPRPGARRVLGKGMHLPPSEGASCEGVRDGLGGGLVGGGPRARLPP